MTSSATLTHDPLWRRVFRSPYARLLVFVGLVFVIQAQVKWLTPNGGLSAAQAMALEIWDVKLWVGALRRALPVLLAYLVLVRLIERRRISEMAAGTLIHGASLGWIFGMALMLLVAGLMVAAGVYRIDGFDSQAKLLTPLIVMSLLPGITEEIIFRGAFFRLVETSLGTWLGLLASAILFGSVHLSNPNATMLTSLAIAVEAGLLLGLCYAWKRSLWFCMSVHAAWNFTQGSLLGISVSGHQIPSLLIGTTQGPIVLSGGEFGAEASILAVLSSLAVSAVIARKAMAAGHWVQPFWMRKETSPSEISDKTYGSD